jgi:hypothetical protein
VGRPTCRQPLFHTTQQLCLLPLCAQYTAAFTELSNSLHQSTRRESVACIRDKPQDAVNCSSKAALFRSSAPATIHWTTPTTLPANQWQSRRNSRSRG